MASAKKLLIPIVILIVGFGAGVVAPNMVPSLLASGSEPEIADSRIIESVKREEQVVLLSLGIQGITEKKGKSTFLGVDVPGSGKASFLQYSFSAKLGLEGKDIRIVQTGDKDFLISVPEFLFIGHANEDFKLVAENKGVLSFITPENDVVDMINSLLSEDAQSEYVLANTEILREQTILFYSSIITAIDPELRIKYDFRQ